MPILTVSTTDLVSNHVQVECTTLKDIVNHVTLLVLNVTDTNTTNVPPVQKELT